MMIYTRTIEILTSDQVRDELWSMIDDGRSQAEVARFFGVGRGRLSEVLSGKREPPKELIRQMGLSRRYIRVTADFHPDASVHDV